MPRTVTNSDQHALGIAQSTQCADAVGRGLPASCVDEAEGFAAGTEPYPVYAKHAEDRFIYEMLEREGWQEKTRGWVDEWIENEDNIGRAARSVGRTPQRELPLRRGYCLFRLKELDSMRWFSVPGGLGSDSHTPQTVVFIALVDLTPENGFFMHLKKGEDVCVDSMAQIKFPPMGGGIGIFFSLNL